MRSADECCQGIHMGQIIRNILFWVVLLIYLPFHLPYVVLGILFGFDAIFRSYSQTLSLIPCVIGNKLRGAFYYLTLEQCSREVTIEFGTFFVWRDCQIGRNVYIGASSIISYADIHDDTLIGSHVNILSGKQQHIFTDINTPIRLQGRMRSKITIGEDCWLGNGAIVMADVGKKSIVAAGSVVVKEAEPFSIVGGNPARLIRMRV